MKFEIIKGDLIQKALAGEFDVIAHGCNCFCVQGAGIAAQMVKHFNTDNVDYFYYEHGNKQGDINKLGIIDFACYDYNNWGMVHKDTNFFMEDRYEKVIVVNCYTQYEPGKNLDYEALTLCMRKINHLFKGKHIGLPGLIGCGIAGGNKEAVEQILRTELRDCNVTICEL